MFDVAEPASPKPGHGGLKLLEAVSNVIREDCIVPKGGGSGVGGSASAAERYFDVCSTSQPASPKPGHGGLKLPKGAIKSVAGMFCGWDDLLWRIVILVNHKINTFTNTIIVCR